MPVAVVERCDALAGPPVWTRSTVHDFFRKANWDNRPIEPPRVQKISPYELSVSQFFHGVDWQWVAPVRSASAGASLAALETTLPGPDSSGLNGSALNGMTRTNAIAADEGLTLDGFTDLF
jgi:hypothetical protein